MTWLTSSQYPSRMIFDGVLPEKEFFCFNQGRLKYELEFKSESDPTKRAHGQRLRHLETGAICLKWRENGVSLAGPAAAAGPILGPHLQ